MQQPFVVTEIWLLGWENMVGVISDSCTVMSVRVTPLQNCLLSSLLFLRPHLVETQEDIWGSQLTFTAFYLKRYHPKIIGHFFRWLSSSSSRCCVIPSRLFFIQYMTKFDESMSKGTWFCYPLFFWLLKCSVYRDTRSSQLIVVEDQVTSLN